MYLLSLQHWQAASARLREIPTPHPAVSQHPTARKETGYSPVQHEPFSEMKLHHRILSSIQRDDAKIFYTQPRLPDRRQSGPA